MANLLSVGIDIGTSTSQMVLSRLKVENTSSSFTIPTIEITDKEVIYKSDIIFTPINRDNLIDSKSIQDFVSEQYRKADVKPDEIETGAIIITGETVRKENSRAVADALSGLAGDFVVATAGPELESVIAGKGSGSYSYSKNHHTSTINYDIGGGTTNLVIFQDGVTVDTTCFDIGGRLIRVDNSQNVTYISPKYQDIIRQENISIHMGEPLNNTELNKLFDILIEVLENAAGIGEKSKYYNMLLTNNDFSNYITPEVISFSGGVADAVYGNNKSVQEFEYGDIGVLFGRYIPKSKLFETYDVYETEETIRATVVGAGSHTTDVSGSTILYHGDIFPMKNVPVIRFSREEQNAKDLVSIMKNKYEWFKVEEEKQVVAFAFEGIKNPSFNEVQEFSETLLSGLQDLITENFPIIIILREDMAKALGHSFKAKLPKDYEFICMDSVAVNDGDYIDIGKPISGGRAIPIVIKTLAFS
ncbi:ethanolamine ammonia-lyase reactivating factor EutA [Suicoccus acidiformans]|uniref:Ethanolamine ammonia-lyase reactivating factor EutA n=1 Tax=Suicoccus acidiformans TaxID=2036206 RepID=A0A347WLZ3_9LACT|nr:ethanolamine ammonia-lyase reactivating factor EutA [Suicoccus acidiformans]AXY26100.1 ethanolamine ammonia-lyase reactivating factor EutA [Suicoccus acidiformans]